MGKRKANMQRKQKEGINEIKIDDNRFRRLLTDIQHLSYEQKNRVLDVLLPEGLKGEVQIPVNEINKKIFEKGRQTGQQEGLDMYDEHYRTRILPYLRIVNRFTGHTVYIGDWLHQETDRTIKALQGRSEKIASDVQALTKYARALELDGNEGEITADYIRHWHEIGHLLDSIEIANNNRDREIAIERAKEKVGAIAGDFYAQVAEIPLSPKGGKRKNRVISRLCEKLENFRQKDISLETAYDELTDYYQGRELSRQEKEESDYLEGWSFEAAKKALTRRKKEPQISKGT